MNRNLERWRQKVRTLKTEAHAVFLASKDPRVPWYAKVLAASVLAYLFSPIDLIPDFIPVLGYLDDLIIVPAGLLLVTRLIPVEVMAEHRETARIEALERTPKLGRSRCDHDNLGHLVTHCCSLCYSPAELTSMGCLLPFGLMLRNNPLPSAMYR